MVTLEELVGAGGRAVASGADRFEHVVVDSRQARPGDLFVALRGERTDGHRFVRDAFEHGAAGALVREMPPSVPGGRTVVQVTDPARTLWNLADRRRARTPLRMVGITGSVGKTTTKEFTADLLAIRYRTFRTQGNLNSEIGLPMSLLELGGREEAGVAELGMRGPGEIRMLSELARPQVGVITNIGLSHIGQLGSQDAIAKAKAELFEALPPDGVAILPGDEAYLPFLVSWAACETWTVGLASDDTVRAENVRPDPGGTRFDLVHGRDRASAYLPVIGSHFLVNALLAAAAARALDVPIGRIAEAMALLKAQPGRARVVRGEGLTVVDDAYNSSPASLAAAVQVLMSLGEADRHVALVGEMRELGGRSRQYHYDSGQAIGRSGLDLLVVVGGPDAQALAEGARAAGMSRERVDVVADVPGLIDGLSRWVRKGDAVLVKGSHALGLERVVVLLTGLESLGSDSVVPGARSPDMAEGTGSA